jgi:hypothetical protein
MSDPLIAVDERMIEDKRITESRGLSREIWREILATKTLAGLRESRF